MLRLPAFASAALVLISSSVAFAAPPGVTEPSSFPEPVSESSWDIPGWFVIDADDGLSESQVADLGEELGVALAPTGFAPESRVVLAKAREGALGALLARLRGDGRVERAEPLAWVRANFVPNDPLLEKQWHMDRIGALSAWDYGTGRGVTVAVVDTGIACEDHGPFRKGTDLNTTPCVPGWNFVAKNAHANDDQGHGSHVAGTIAQSTDNGIGAVGVAFHAQLMPVKVLSATGSGTTADVAAGIRWAADHGAHVINLSLGGPRNSGILEDAVKHARSRGAVVVAAAGNSGGSVGFPGATTGVIGVSATGPDDKLAAFSSRGKGVDIAAPGVDVIQQTICNGGQGGCERFPGYSGTSMASPHVAGVAALLVSQGVTDIDAVERELLASARVVDPSEGAQRLYGAGILDAAAAVRAVWMKQTFLRLAILAALVGLLFAQVRRQRGASGQFGPGFWIAALAAGPGLLWFMPLLASRAILPLDLLARPIGDLDLLVSPAIHDFLPLANALVPFGLTALLFGVRAARPVVAGFAIGTAAYLGAVPLLGHIAGPMGATALAGWCLVNAALCYFVARINLLETK